jgi:hypothetical protein
LYTIGCCTLGEKLREAARNGLGDFKKPIVFHLREIAIGEQLLQTNNLGAFPGRLFHIARGLFEILVNVLADCSLDKPDFK